MHRSVCTVRSPVSVCVPTREPEGSRAPPVHTPLLWTTGTRYQPKSVKFVTRAERARVSWISSGHNLSQVWPGEAGGTNPQGHQAPESSLREGWFFGKTQQSKEEELHCSSRLSLQDYYDRGRGTGGPTRKGPQQSQNASCKQNPLVPMKKPRDVFFPFPSLPPLLFHRYSPPFPAFPPPECSRQEGWLYVKPTLPHPISKQGQMNHIVNAHRVSQTSLEVKQIAFALWGLGHPKENKQNQTNKSLFQVPISNGNVKWVCVYHNGDF